MNLSLQSFPFPFVYFLFLSFPLPAQIQNVEQIEYCGSSIMQSILFKNRPEIEQKQINFDKNSAVFFKLSPQLRVEADYVLPVVVHIIHNNGAENISDATVAQGIQNLNDAYANLGYYNPTTGVDTKIQFCLAKRDENGNPTTGITRDVSALTEMFIESDDVAVKDINRWDPTKYINIWLVKEICSYSSGCGVAGYAYFPSAHGSDIDGIMMEARWFGATNATSGVQIHEMGHYLGLYHTFQGGCMNNDCLTDGDHVCDTPPDQSTIAVPCDAEVNSCSTDTDSGFATDQNDMTWNYMDYGDWSCYSAFTQGQTDRMHYTIENIRNSLLDSDGCEEPCQSAITASFSVTTPVYVGTPVSFTNTSTNATNYNWQIDGVTFSTAPNPTYIFSTEGTFEISLVATNADPNCHDNYSLSVNVTCPVDAFFVASDAYPLPGDEVTFTNESQNGTTYEWSVAGTSLSTNQDFSYSFSNPGTYQVCLKVRNGVCEDEFCKFILVSDENSSECVGTFIRKIGNYGENEMPVTVLSAGDGKFFGGGRKDNTAFLFIIDVDGNLLSEKTFDLTSGSSFIDDILLDSDGNLLLLARDQPNSETSNFIIKYNYTTENVIWIREYPIPAYTRFERVIELNNSGNYLVSGFVETSSQQGDAILLEVNRSTGDLIWQKQYGLAAMEVFTEIIEHNNSIYAGGFQRANGGNDKIRASLTQLDLSGNIIWNRIYFNSPSTTGRTYMHRVIINNSSLTTLSRGSLVSDNYANSDFQLMNTTMNGVINWAKNYHIVGGTYTQGRHIIKIPNGYIIHGTSKIGGNNDFFFARVDDTGNLIWNKSISTDYDDKSISFDLFNDHIYFFGRTQAYDSGNNYDALFGKMTLDGEISGNGCELVKDIEIEAEDISDSYDGEMELTVNIPTNPLNDFSLTPGEVSVTVENVPGCECDEYSEPTDSCGLKPDATIILNNFECQNESVQVSVTVCNKGVEELPINTPISFYAADPTQMNAMLLTVIHTGEAIAGNNCITFSLPTNFSSGTQVFAVINDNGTTPRPFSLDNEFGNTNIFECDYANNIGNLIITYDTPVLDLGPDILLCDNAVIELDAGDGFSGYQWSDGTTEQTLTTSFEGTYSVTVTDECGISQSDDVQIQFDPISQVELGADTMEICPGTSISFSVDGYEDYHWFPAEIFACNDCSEVSTLIDTATLVILVANDNLGCFTTDSVYIKTADTLHSEENILFCPGDSVVFNDSIYYEPTTIFLLIESPESCDTLKTIHIEKRDDLELTVNPTKFICDGSCTSLSVAANRTIDSVFWSGENIDSTNSIAPVVCPASDSLGITTKIYEVIVTDAFGCAASAATTVQVTEPLAVVTGQDTTVCKDKIVTSSVSTNLSDSEENGNIFFVWSENPGNPNPNRNIAVDSTKILATRPLSTIGRYEFIISAIQDSPHGIGNCRATDNVIITVEDCDDCDIYIPNVFSPNGDNINDVFSPHIICELENYNIKIFDRWGGKVFETTDINKGWDGKFHNKPAPVDVFTFVITGILNGKEKVFAGDVTLVR